MVWPVKGDDFAIELAQDSATIGEQIRRLGVREISPRIPTEWAALLLAFE
jgi:hypothetical protein